MSRPKPASGGASDSERLDTGKHPRMWAQIRSHAPVQADGVTPFGSTLAFGGIGYQAVTLTLKHRF